MKELVITVNGKPGSGKTRVIEIITEALKNSEEFQCIGISPPEENGSSEHFFNIVFSFK